MARPRDGRAPSQDPRRGRRLRRPEPVDAPQRGPRDQAPRARRPRRPHPQAHARSVILQARAGVLLRSMAMRSRLEQYLSALPRALDSFADCRAKGSLIRTSLQVRPLTRSAALPAPLASHVRSPPLASQWVPEVHYVALSLATADK
ncbi:MAG: hypothetical protein ACK56I_36200, partial [bacterium]